MPARPLRLTLKYGMDRLLAPVALSFLTPLLGAVALAIKLDDGGDVFFRQERVGEGGQTFRIWKFRTMVPDAEQLGGGYVPEGMELVTRVGELLRRTSLDELPQILNILSGDMSFVGPRPALASQVVRYTQEQRRRLEVRPGVTGWAMLHGRNTVSWSKRIEYDLEYIERAGVLFDFYILGRTIPLVVRGTDIDHNVTPEQVDDLARE